MDKDNNYYQRNIFFFSIGIMYVPGQPCAQLFVCVVLVDVVKCFVASALNTGVACHCLQLQIQMELVTG